MARAAREVTMTNLVLLLGGEEDASPSAGHIRALVGSKTATVASVHLPTISSDGCLDREEFFSCHYQHGVDLASIGEDFRLRDIVLVKSPKRDSQLNFALVHLWNWPHSTYDINTVRIPHDTWVDPRNNPLGKNPGNVWSFSEPLKDRGRGEQAKLIQDGPPETVAGGHLELGAIERLVSGHTKKGDEIHIWSTDDDLVRVTGLVENLDRSFRAIPNGEPDPPRKIPVLIGESPVEPLPEGAEYEDLRAGNLRVSDAEARFFMCDCRAGIPHLPEGSVNDVITSPPYNIGYDPFNVPKPDPSTGEVRSPLREGYEDGLPAEKYHHLLWSTFQYIGDKLDPKSSDVFVNLKNNYRGGDCRPPFWLLQLVPDSWKFTDLLVWRYDISYDPARNKYKPYYEWLFRFTRGHVNRRLGHRLLQDFYIPILKGNSRERKDLVHPAVYPMELVKMCLRESLHSGLVLDPFLGSGSTLAAAREMRRPSVGFEVEEKYRADIKRRIERASVPAAA